MRLDIFSGWKSPTRPTQPLETYEEKEANYKKALRAKFDRAASKGLMYYTHPVRRRSQDEDLSYIDGYLGWELVGFSIAPDSNISGGREFIFRRKT